MNKQDNSPVGVGLVTVFTVLLVLALFTFSVLTLASARADYRLSHINADTVSDYYAADGKAAVLAAEFAEGTDTELERTIPMNDTQLLYIHLVRRADGSVQTLAWNMIPADDTSFPEDGHLGVLEDG